MPVCEAGSKRTAGQPSVYLRTPASTRAACSCGCLLKSKNKNLSKTAVQCPGQPGKPSAQQAGAPVRYTPALELEV